MSKTVVRTIRPIGLGLSLVLALVAGALLSSLMIPTAEAAVLQITTTTVDAGQIGVGYLYAFQANGGQSLGASGATNWEIRDTATRTFLANTIGLAMNAEGILSGTPKIAILNFPFNVYCDSNGTSPSQRGFQLTIAGKLVFDSGPNMPIDSIVLPGSSDVPMFQFTAQALGEDIDITTLTFFGLGTGSDTFDVENVNIWDDANSDGKPNGAEQKIIPTSIFRTDQGFLSSEVTLTFGANILRIDSGVNSGTRCLLVTYDFKSAVKPTRTFRLALERPTDIGYKTLTTVKTYTGDLGGGAPYSQYNTMTLHWKPDTYFMSAYKGGIMTIGGDTPGLPTLYMNNTRDIAGPRLVRAGEETTALGLEFWADSTFTIILQSIKVTDSGTGDAATQIQKGVLYLDNDRNGLLSVGDAQIMEATPVGNTLTFLLAAPREITTPAANRSDPGALFLIVTYKFKTNVPITIPNLTFQGRIPAASDIEAIEKVGSLAARISPDTPSLWGVPIAINLPADTAVSGGTTEGPYPTRAIWYDIDTNHVVSKGDTILITFDTNLASATPAINNFLLPVLGDYLGNGATFNFLGANKLKVTLGDFAKLTIPGTFVLGTTAEGSPSGINLKDTNSGITSVHSLAAGPAVNVVDIESGAVSYAAPAADTAAPGSGSDTSGTSAASGVGDKACITMRLGLWRGFLPSLRAARDFVLTSPVGRLLARIYYWL